HIRVRFLSELVRNVMWDFFFLVCSPPPISTLFPYTTLFRSLGSRAPAHSRDRQPGHRQPLDPRVLALLGKDGDDADEYRQRLVADRKSTRLNSSHVETSYAVFCLKKKKTLKIRSDIKRRAPT